MENRINRKQTREAPKLIAHRGFHLASPQNSLSAFRAAGERGFWAIETDVRRSRDGVLVCCHNDTVDSLYDGTGRIEELSWEELSRLRYREAPGEGMPLFREYLAACREGGALPFIETKTDDVEQVLGEALSWFPPEELIVSSIQFSHLLAARAACGGVFLHHIFSTPEQMRQLAELGSCGVSYRYDHLEEVPAGLLEETHRAGVLVCLRAGDTPETVRRMIELGLDYIPTNRVTKEEL